MKKILILASNPRKDLNLDREIRDLKSVIERSRNREDFMVEIALAVRVGDLQELLFQHQPQIVHFCGHGEGIEGLVFESDAGAEHQVRSGALSDLFRLFASQVDCVLLNACYSKEQATAIVEHINYVVGMRRAIRDDAAIAFSKGFYLALGYACSIEQAFEFGCNAIRLEISESSINRSSLSEGQRMLRVAETINSTEIPEHWNPILLKGSGVGASSTVAPEKRMAIQVDIDRALDFSKEQQYRDQVREFLVDRKLSSFELIQLEQLRKKLGISEADASQIEMEEQEFIRRGQQEYQELLVRLIVEEGYPFNSETLDKLQQYREELDLTNTEIEMISQPILVAAEEDWQGQCELERQNQEVILLQRQQQRLSELQRQEKERRILRFKTFEFESATVSIEKAGFLGLQKTCNVSYRKGKAEYFAEDLDGIFLEMVAIPGGSFMMGSILGKREPLIGLEASLYNGMTHSSESPQHSVVIKPFYLGKFVVTQAQWRLVHALPQVKNYFGIAPSRFKGDNRPVEQVSWSEAVEFCARLSRYTGRQYRLPSESEWEYACRAGTTTIFHTGQAITSDLANYADQIVDKFGVKAGFRQQTTDVDSFPPNAFGLYDMHGNVQEWCADCWHENYDGAPNAGSVWRENGSKLRVVRGGAWKYDLRCSRSASRSSFHSSEFESVGISKFETVGFRVALSLI
jgi:formylglycine-generating enzyme required for sulfatase activity